MSGGMFEMGAVVLGYFGTVASWRRLAPRQNARDCDYRTVVITNCSSTDEGAHEPAASVTINGREALLALRNAIDEAPEGACVMTDTEHRRADIALVAIAVIVALMGYAGWL